MRKKGGRLASVVCSAAKTPNGPENQALRARRNVAGSTLALFRLAGGGVN
jgi:hypothetical protein